MTLLALYYKCTALAEDGLLTQRERFACNHTYQMAKRQFLDEEFHSPSVVLTREQNTLAYLRFKDWEAENPGLVQDLKTQ